MARSVLNRSATSLLFFCLVVCAQLFAQDASGHTCSVENQEKLSADRSKDLKALQQTAKASAFYQELVRKVGQPVSCRASADEDSLRLSYTFGSGAKLNVLANPAIESAEHRLELPGLSKDSTLPLLKGEEKSLFGDEGCGIVWDRPEKEKSGNNSEAVYKGTTCNCQARVVYRGRRIVALLMRSAC